MNRDDQCLYLLTDISKCYGKVNCFSIFSKRKHNFGNCTDFTDVNCDVLLFVETLVDNVQSKCQIQSKKNTDDYCLHNLEISYSFVEFYVDRDFLDKLIKSFH